MAGANRRMRYERDYDKVYCPRNPTRVTTTDDDHFAKPLSYNPNRRTSQGDSRPDSPNSVGHQPMPSFGRNEFTQANKSAGPILMAGGPRAAMVREPSRLLVGGNRRRSVAATPVALPTNDPRGRNLNRARTFDDRFGAIPAPTGSSMMKDNSAVTNGSGGSRRGLMGDSSGRRPMGDGSARKPMVDNSGRRIMGNSSARRRAPASHSPLRRTATAPTPNTSVRVLRPPMTVIAPTHRRVRRSSSNVMTTGIAPTRSRPRRSSSNVNPNINCGINISTHRTTIEPPALVSTSSQSTTISNITNPSVCQPSSQQPQTTYVEVQPGLEEPFRNMKETVKAIERNYLTQRTCLACTVELYCIADAKYYICPVCRDISPLCLDGSGDWQHGVGMGFTQTTLDEERQRLR